MKFIADLHIHSKYSRATSPMMNLEDLDSWADDKGILVMATGDFLHGRYLKEIKEKLEPADAGLFKLKSKYKKQTIKGTLSKTRFILSVEISSIYSKGGKVRRIHNLVFVSKIESAESLRNKLKKMGCNLDSDGRPIIGLDSEKLAEIVFNIDKDAVIIPAHAWTPWFSVFGSMSGFDSIEECFGKYADKIFAIETGLSSDSAMNWRLSKLDKVALISNSDSHSLPKIGREANIFDTDVSYIGIMEAIKSGSPQNRRKNLKDNRFVATIEFFPEEGKYHNDGHRTCGIAWSPKETKKHKGICTVCNKPVTVGVLNRVDKLADREIDLKGKNNYHTYDNYVPYYNLVGLEEIIAEALEVRVLSKKVKAKYEELIIKFGSELEILLNVSEKEFKEKNDSKIYEGIKKVREGKLTIRPGYDGEYGIVKIFG
ncbi:DNA helicase UvrD [Candidatus Wolfebacteria bacterium CG10_big_fil_rev_8_21_14_0_10_31_9]|uniref:DNA helicase UvrD n=1 Tax=Candidatus Wolfebacteria bacterium CG10_big_fil_rev_8_21_14_0_10_31_9 TaxID=1975070 RepID=A0A2H0RCC4_9BACT|nr:MAG: DNA helicase UvrD [Candidatus Wolfebacteria bacterium CG10_big_fil_rev_8_21_14_0_10_31_9]